MADLMPMVHAERASLAEFLDTLDARAVDRADVVRQVERAGARRAPHRGGNITAPHFFAGFVKSGFSFDKTVDTRSAQLLRRARRPT